jgi:lycopene beta-cyclase
MGGCRAVDRTYIRAGLTAGGARTSTGYAFQRIQRWADACAQLLGNGHLPAGHPADPVLLQGLDFLFISVLRSRPELAPEIFLSLFERAETARIIRFLSDRGTMRDYAAIAAALPVFPFVHEMPTALLRKLNQLRRRTAG